MNETNLRARANAANASRATKTIATWKFQGQSELDGEDVQITTRNNCKLTFPIVADARKLRCK